MEYSIQKQEEEKKITLVLKGSLDSLSAPEIEDEVLAQLEDFEFNAIFLDCKELDYIASSGLRLFFNVLKSGKAHGSRVVLKEPNDFLRKVLDATGLTAMFEFE
jgi:anti-sigma B factor antagonist